MKYERGERKLTPHQARLESSVYECARGRRMLQVISIARAATGDHDLRRRGSYEFDTRPTLQMSVVMTRPDIFPL